MEEFIYPEIGYFSDYLYNDKRLSENTVKSYLTDLKGYSEFLLKYKKYEYIDSITSKDVEDYILSIKRKGLSKKSIQRKITVIKEFHKFLVDDNILKDNPTRFIDNVKLDKKIPEVLSIEEVEIMISSIKTEDIIGIRNKAILEVLYGSGLRVSELTSLKLSDLHINSQYLSIIGKGNKERIVPMGELEIKALRDYIENSRPILSKNNYSNILFLSYQGKVISRQYIFKLIKEIASSVGITKVISPHTLRHSFATHLLQNGVDLRVVQEMLGHEDISTTEIYTHIENSKLRDVFLNTHPLIKKEE